MSKTIARSVEDVADTWVMTMMIYFHDDDHRDDEDEYDDDGDDDESDCDKDDAISIIISFIIIVKH